MNGQSNRALQEHMRVLEQYRALGEGNWVDLAAEDEARNNLCQHLFGAEQFEVLFALVAESDAWAKARYRREGDYAGFLGDLDLAWRWVESDAAWDVARQIRCLLIRCGLQGLSAPATQDPESAIQWFLGISARHMPPEACLDALAIARGLADIDLKANLLAAFAAHLPETFRNESMVAVLAIAGPKVKGRALVMRLRELPPELLNVGIQTVWASLPEEDDSGKAFTLGYLGFVLPDDAKPLALNSAAHIEDPQARADALADLAFCWSGDWRERAMLATLQALRAIADEGDRIVTLARFLEQWGEQGPASQQLEPFFQETTDSYFRLAALSIVLPFLREDRIVPLATEALAVAAAISAAEQRAASLLPLLDYPLGEVRSRVLETAWQAIGAITDHKKKLWRYRELIGKLNTGPEDALRRRAAAEARDTIASISDDWQKVVELERLALLVPEIQAELYEEALRTAMSIGDATGRARMLGKVAYGFLETPQQPALRSCLASLYEVGDARVKSTILRNLATSAPPDLVLEVLALTETINDPNPKAEVLIYLATHLTSEVGRQALELARAMQDNRILASVLATLARNVADGSKASLLREALAISSELPPGNKPEPARSTIFHWIVNAWRKASFSGASRGDVTLLLHALGQAPLPDVLQDFADYLPLAEHLAGAGMLAPTVKALRDVLAWWPQPGVAGETRNEPEDSLLNDNVPF